jgi:hypothetical protein
MYPSTINTDEKYQETTPRLLLSKLNPEEDSAMVSYKFAIFDENYLHENHRVATLWQFNLHQAKLVYLHQ